MCLLHYLNEEKSLFSHIFLCIGLHYKSYSWLYYSSFFVLDFYNLSLKGWELRDEHFCKELFYVAAWASEGWRLVILIILLTFLGSWVLPFYVWHITSTKRTTIFYHVWHGKNLEPIAKKTALPGKANFGLYIDQKRSLIIFIYHKIRKPHIFHKKRLRDNEKW